MSDAPTEILANQHYKTLCRFLGDMPVNIELLTGSTKPAVRKRIHQNLRNGLCIFWWEPMLSLKNRCSSVISGW
jgi:hypothetical protein